MNNKLSKESNIFIDMEYKKDYFGYVYEWLNITNNMKYIGSHYGSVNDSYLGSSKWFLSSYNKNRNFFIMKVLEYINLDNPKQVLLCEQKWLDKIDDIKSNSKFYNLKNEAEGGWSHVTDDHINKRAKTLKEKHKLFGLSESKIKSYKYKLKTRTDRWKLSGFSNLEKEQHNNYSIKVKIITPNNKIEYFDSLSKASFELGFDAVYGAQMTKKRGSYKGYNIYRISEPVIDCRKFRT